MGYYRATVRFEATTEEERGAKNLRQNAIAAIRTAPMDAETRDLIEWMIGRCPEETLQRKVRRHEAEQWFTETLSLLNVGDCFTMRGLFNTYNAPQKVKNYGVFILSNLVDMGILETVTSDSMSGLMQVSTNCKIYRLRCQV